MNKVCSKCGIEKLIEEFYKGISYCKQCRCSQTEAYRQKNLEHDLTVKKQYYKKNREHIRKDKKDKYKQNPDIIRSRAYAWRQLNKEKAAAACSAWKKKNREYVNSYEKNINNKRKNTDVIFKLKNNIRSRLRKAIRYNYKSGSAIRYLGCTIEELKKYLQLKFQDGMTWDNYGQFGWHIDHIQPLSKFDLSDLEQLKIVCHYTNLQPLWAKDNLKKSNKEIT